MMKSLYSGVAGMKTHNQRMDVIGNNISNVNTTGYKTSAVTFKDVYYQTKANASSGDATSGGKNPTQIGYGAQLGTVSQIMTQSGFTYSDSYYDCALQGEGFFQVMDDNGNIFYTRAGKFSIDSYGNLCDPNGYMVLGVSGDPTGIETGQSQRINIKVPAVQDNKASATKSVNGYDITVTADSPGEQGNISFSIINSDTPYATKSGSTLTIYLNLDQDFGGEAFNDYCDIAIDALINDNAFLGLETGGTFVDADGNTQNMTVADKLDQIAKNVYVDDEATRATTPRTSEYNRAAYEALSKIIDDYVSGDAAATAPAATVRTITEARTEYTQEALDDFESKLNDAITQGGVGLEEGVLPLDVSFESLPPFSQVQSLQATNTLELTQKDASGNVVRDNDGNAVGTKLTFTANKAGEYANKYEIDLKYSSSVGSSPVAKWKDSTLTITVPNNCSLADIQAAVDKAADGIESRMLTVSAESIVARTTTDDEGNVTTTYQPFSDLSYSTGTGDDAVSYNVDFSNLLGNSTERLGLDGGRDNFFSDIATAMSTVSLTDGRVAAEQAVDDLETLRIQSDGTIIGVHAVHGTLFLGRIDIATFENPTGLEQTGISLWRASVASGPAQVKIAGSEGAGEVVSGALEMSNVDLAQEFSDMIITQRGYQANSRIITVSDTMLEELINLKR